MTTWRCGAIGWAVLLSGVSPAHGNNVCSAAGRLWDADGNGELAHCSASGRRRGRGFCKLDFSSEASAGSSQTVSENDRCVVLLQPVTRCRPRSLFRSPSVPSPVSRPSAKRPDCPVDDTTPVRVKRRRSLAGSQVTTQEQNPDSPRVVSPPPAAAVPEPRTFRGENNPVFSRRLLKLRPLSSRPDLCFRGPNLSARLRSRSCWMEKMVPVS